jgi:hypothetical protein
MVKKRAVVAGVLVAALSVLGMLSASAQTAAPVQVNDDGVGKPPKGTGLGTTAALENPKCNAAAIDGWGVFPQLRQNDGPLCVAPAPADNGGATARGVTADTIKVVVMVPNDEQVAAHKQAGNQMPKNTATGTEGTFEDAFRDSFAIFTHSFETWGRTVELKFVTSSGSDEASQRADALTVKAQKPMFVIDNLASGLSTLAAVLAADKYVVYSFGTTTDDAVKQAPYRWGVTDSNVTSLNIAEFIGKQLTKGKAEYAGDEFKTKPRTFGTIVPGSLDTATYQAAMKKQGVTLTVPPLEYTANGSPTGDPAKSQQEAPALIAKLKDAGVTSVVLFTDLGMTNALTQVAAQQEYSPEWIITGFWYQDISVIARSYDQEQWSHAFGISNLNPIVQSATTSPTLSDWYWGKGASTTDTPSQINALWLATAIHYAGPNLTPKNVAAGLFSVPARLGAAGGDPASIQVAWGKTAGLPTPSYFARGADFAPVWYDQKTTGDSQIYPSPGKGVTWYLDDAKRYTTGTWPKTKLEFFDKTGAVIAFATPPVDYGEIIPCEGCPSAAGTGTPAAAG